MAKAWSVVRSEAISEKRCAQDLRTRYLPLDPCMILPGHAKEIYFIGRRKQNFVEANIDIAGHDLHQSRGRSCPIISHEAVLSALPGFVATRGHFNLGCHPNRLSKGPSNCMSYMLARDSVTSRRFFNPLLFERNDSIPSELPPARSREF